MAQNFRNEVGQNFRNLHRFCLTQETAVPSFCGMPLRLCQSENKGKAKVMHRSFTGRPTIYDENWWLARNLFSCFVVTGFRSC
jgi:hypothetical protein